MREGRVYFTGLQRDPLLLALREVLQGAHVVEPVRQLDQDDPGVICHRQQQLAVVLHLVLGTGPELHLPDFGHPVYQVGDLVAEKDPQVRQGYRRVLDSIVDQARHDRGGVQAERGQYGSHLDRVLDVRSSRRALLPGVCFRRRLVGCPNLVHVQPVRVGL